MPSTTKTAAFENYPANAIMSGNINASLATATSQTQDVEIMTRSDWLQVMSDLTGSANGDLTVTVTPYASDGLTLTGFTITANPTAGPTVAGGHVRAMGQYGVIGLKKVQIKWTNANAGTQTLIANWVQERV